MKMFSSFLKISIILAIISYVYGSRKINETNLSRCTPFRTYSNEYNVKFPITSAHYDGKYILLVFYVKSDKDASIMLFSKTGRATNKPEAYEIILSTNERRPSEIRSTGQEIVAKNFKENSILSPKEWRPFWIRLSPDGSIEVGKEIGSSAFLSWRKEKKRMPINHVGFASHGDVVVHWAFHCPENNPENKTVDFTQCIYLNTTKYEYNAAFPIVDDIEKDFYFKFYVKAKEQAHIVLSPTWKPTANNERAYEIVLGGFFNSGGGIRTVRGGDSKISYTEYNMLSPNEWRPFWIRISPDGFIQVGKETGSPAFMSWKDENPTFGKMGTNNYSVASYNGGIVDWALECSKKQFRKGL